MRLGLAGVTTAAAIAAAVTASAASLGGISPGGLGAGYAPISACDSDGVDVSYTVASGAVQELTLIGIAGPCAGGSLKVVLTDAAGAAIGAGGPEVVITTSLTVSLSPQPQATAVEAVHVSIDGP